MSEDKDQRDPQDQWRDFIPPPSIPISHPWMARYFPSQILHHEQGPAGSNEISTLDKEVYYLNETSRNSDTAGNSSTSNTSRPSIAFRIGNGGAGYTGLLRALSETYLETTPSHLANNNNNSSSNSSSPNESGNTGAIAWTTNHSRHTQAALLADIVQVALTYESLTDDIPVEREKWARRVGVAFWDHFILVGPAANPAALQPGIGGPEAFKKIAESKAKFLSRGDGSATFEREKAMWRSAGIDLGLLEKQDWLQTLALPPYEALRAAREAGAYILTDRATFLTAARDGVVQGMGVFVEGGEELLNPCAALVNLLVVDEWPAARRFAEWLVREGGEAQELIRGFGRDWERGVGLPLFTVGMEREFQGAELLAGREF